MNVVLLAFLGGMAGHVFVQLTADVLDEKIAHAVHAAYSRCPR